VRAEGVMNNAAASAHTAWCESGPRNCTRHHVGDCLTDWFLSVCFTADRRAPILRLMASSTQIPIPRVWRTPIQVKFSDTDALGHVNNAILTSFLEHGRRALFRTVFPGVHEQVVIASLKVDFLREVMPEHAVEVEVSVERVGTSSMTLNEYLLAEREIAVRAQTVIVHLDPISRRPAPIPESVCALLRGGLS
jgi:acyl-CoA thioester hydrolase